MEINKVANATRIMFGEINIEDKKQSQSINNNYYKVYNDLHGRE